MNRKLVLFLTTVVLISMVFSGFLYLWNPNLPTKSITSTSSSVNPTVVIGNPKNTAIAMTDDVMGNLFVLWSNGEVFEHPDLSGNNWVYLGNSASFGSYNNVSVNLGIPVGIRASYNWETQNGNQTGLVMVLFSNGYSAQMEYGLNPSVWQFSKLPSAGNYVSLSYDLNSYYYLGSHKQAFYATEQNGITYAFSDNYYTWTTIINTTVSHNLTSVLAWPNNFAPPTLGTTVLLGVSKSGHIYFAEGNTNPLLPLKWQAESQISPSTNNDFIGLTQTSNPNSAYYYYAIEKNPGSELYASGIFNGSGPSFSPVGRIPSIMNQTALQNKYFGFTTESNELILTQNGTIYSTTNEGSSFSLYAKVPYNIPSHKLINVMPWIYQTGSGSFNGMNRLQSSLNQLNETSSNYTMVSYEFYQLQANGQIKPLTTGSLSYANSSNPNNITPYVHKLGLGAVPMIISASAGQIYNFTSNKTKMSEAIYTMTDYALVYNYTGYDIDWEPTSANATTGIQFTNFLNQFSLTLDKFNKKLFVEVANWDPSFWNYSSLGNTNITSVNIMDYAGLYSGPNSFLSEMQQGIAAIPSGKLSISLENTNPNTDYSNFTAIEMEQRFMSLENAGITTIGIWDMPFNNTLISQIQDFKGNLTSSSYRNSFEAGSSGLSISNDGGVISNSMTFSYNQGSYLYGSANSSTTFQSGTILTNFTYHYSGSVTLNLYIQNSTGWHNYSKLSKTSSYIVLPSRTQNVKISFGSFTGITASSSNSETITYSINYTDLQNASWVNILYQTGASLYVNGSVTYPDTIINYGAWTEANLSMAPSTYNISIEESGYQGYFDIVTTSSGNTTYISSQITALAGDIMGMISPYGATVTLNGAPLTVTSGKFDYSGPSGIYTVSASMIFYQTITETVTIRPNGITYVNISLQYLPPTPVIQYTPQEVNSTTYNIAWSSLFGTDFKNYSIYLSNESNSQGSFVASLTSVSDTSYNLSGLSPNTTYYVTIITYAQNGYAKSNVETFTTPAQNNHSPSSLFISGLDYIIIGAVIVAVIAGGVTLALKKNKGGK